MVKKAIIIFFGITLFFSCQSEKPIKRLSDEGLMYAMIYDYDNTPVNAVEVYLNGKKTVDSDIQGRFVLDKMKNDEYTIKLEKKGYETLEADFHFDPLQVLYFKMINSSQLVAFAETAMDNKEYSSAENFINRALVLEPHRYDILFLKSITCYMQGRNQEALQILEEMIRSGCADNAVMRFLEIITQAK